MTTAESKGWRRGLESRPLLGDHPIAFRVTLVLWVLGGALFFALQVPALREIVQDVDDVVHTIAVNLEFSPLVWFATALDFLGSTWVTTPVIVGVAVYLALRKQWSGLVYWTVAMALSQAMIGPIKALYARPRPPLPLVETMSYSFPSGHAVAGAAIAVSLVIVLVPPGPRRRNLEMLAAAFAVIMGLSRVYLRAHWLSDVVAGVALGASVAIGVAVLMHYLTERGHDEPTQRDPDSLADG